MAASALEQQRRPGRRWRRPARGRGTAASRRPAGRASGARCGSGGGPQRSPTRSGERRVVGRAGARRRGGPRRRGARRPAPRGGRAGTPGPAGPASQERTRCQASSLVHAMVRAAAAIGGHQVVGVAARRGASATASWSWRASTSPGSPGQAVQLDPGAEQHVVGRLEGVVVAFQQHRLGGLGPPQGVHVAQPAAAVLEVRLEQEGHLAGRGVARVDAVGQSSVSHRLRALAPLGDPALLQRDGEPGVAGQVAQREVRRGRVEVVVGQRERLLDGAHGSARASAWCPRSGTRPARRPGRCPAWCRAGAAGRGRSTGPARPARSRRRRRARPGRAPSTVAASKIAAQPPVGRVAGRPGPGRAGHAAIGEERVALGEGHGGRGYRPG